MEEILIHYLLWLLGFIFLFKVYTLTEEKEDIEDINFSIIIPARNEQKNIENLLQSIKAQNIQPQEIIVVDDCSNDKTAEIALKNGALVITLKTLPGKWTGKNWACYNGAKSARTKLLLFLDADVKIESRDLHKILSAYKKDHVIITIQPFHTIKKVYEQFSLFFNIILIGGFGAFTAFGKRIKPAGLFGPCILINKDTYLKSFKQKEIKGNILENIKLGQYLMKHNQEIKYYCGKNGFSFRMYSGGMKHLIGGWSKGFFAGSLSTFFPLLIMIILWISGAVGAVRFLTLNALSFDILPLNLSILLYLLYAGQIYWMARKAGNFNFLAALFYPLPLLFFFLIFVKSFYHRIISRRTSWKQRKIKIRK